MAVARRYEVPVSHVVAALPDNEALALELAQIRYEAVLAHARRITEKPAQQARRRVRALRSDDPDERLAAAVVGR